MRSGLVAALVVVFVASVASSAVASPLLSSLSEDSCAVSYDESPQLLKGSAATLVVPDSLFVKGLDWFVVAHAGIDTSGRLTNVRILRADPLFTELALEALAAYRFSPAKLRGRPVAVDTWGLNLHVRPQTRDRLIRTDHEVWGVEPGADGFAHVTTPMAKQFALRVAKALVRDRLGKDFYHNHVRSDTSHIDISWEQRGLEPGVCRVSLAMDTPSGAANPILWMRIAVGSDGRAQAEYGVPDCVADPGECEFAISADQALAVARTAGLQSAPEDWRVSFGWREIRGTPTYAWVVSRHRRQDGPGSHGGSIVIDANDGKVEAPGLRLH